MFYSIRHVTRFRYSVPVSESVMEVRMHPRSDGMQRSHSFQLRTSPRSAVMSYRDYLGNTIHHFNIPARHAGLTISVEAHVEVTPPAPLPDALPPDAWDALDALAHAGDHWDMLQPGRFAHPSELLRAFAAEIGLRRGPDPLSTLRSLSGAIYRSFGYDPDTTHVHSPVDDALRARRGVCQDFAHIMIALAREIGIPCRYVSGYLFHRVEDHDRSEADASHAWVEALLPGLGWVGFDPTNNLVAGERHIRVAVGRDYDDVPPTRGVFKGQARSTLDVSVYVGVADPPEPEEEFVPQPEIWVPLDETDAQAQQMQQQQ